MEGKTFVWTTELTKKLCQMIFANEWLFKKRKQPWADFRKILLKNGFPEEMTIDQVRKKWSYTYDTYRLAKKTRNKNFKYYKLFEKHYGKTKVLDKFETWTDEWRSKLITCIAEAKQHKLDDHAMWPVVERAMRSQDLPDDCCVCDMKNLWHHINTTFIRKHRYKLKKSTESTKWPLYKTMLEFYETYENEQLVSLECELSGEVSILPKVKGLHKPRTHSLDNQDEENEFNWTKNITESFIQVRLQNDWLFRERSQPWRDFTEILRKEYGFPSTLSSREACRKWATVVREYQKAKATNYTSWLYHNIFELYLGDGKLTLNPIVDWQEEWVFHLISARSDLDHLFVNYVRNQDEGWRDVEKRLRKLGLPLDYSLLELPEIWLYLCKTYKWKRKFKLKGLLTEQWPYYDAMERYTEKPKMRKVEKKQVTPKEEYHDFGDECDDYEDDIKLFDLKQRMQPKSEVVNQCRACAESEASLDIFEHRDKEGTNLAAKLKAVGGIEVERSDNLPALICGSCLQELEKAYKFRRKCQNADTLLRSRSTDDKIKLEYLELSDAHDDNVADEVVLYVQPHEANEPGTQTETKVIKTEKKERLMRKKKGPKLRYDYWKICEICGKNTRNLVGHLDMHNTEKRYSCDVCDKKFKFKSGLILHKATHNPTPRKTCEICGKTFHVMAQYRRHFVYHANERKFGCDTCGKRFNTLDILRVHKYIHTDERSFSCSECGKSFRTAGCVSRHKRIVHKSLKKVQ